MKSLVITVSLAALVAYSGSFLKVWSLPHQTDPYTIENLKPAVQKVFGFTEDLRSNRSTRARENEILFAESGASFENLAPMR